MTEKWQSTEKLLRKVLRLSEREKILFARRKVGNASRPSLLGWLVDALAAEGIRFHFAEMTAAILQGVPTTTLDADIWLGVAGAPACQSPGHRKKTRRRNLARIMVALDDDTLVNFLYRIEYLNFCQRA